MFAISTPSWVKVERGVQYNVDVLRMGRTELHAGDVDRVLAPTQVDARINIASMRVDREVEGSAVSAARVRSGCRPDQQTRCLRLLLGPGT